MKKNNLLGLLILTVPLSLIGISINGIYLGFKTHALTGILALIFPPVGLVFGAGNLFAGSNLAQQLMNLF